MTTEEISADDVLDDKGWHRRLVVLAAFFIGFLTDGLMLSFGVLLLEFLEEFQSDRAITTIVGSLTAGVMYLAGPFAGLLSGILGGRTVVIMGTLISFGGFLGASFANSLLTLSMTCGIFGGLGSGLMYLPVTAYVVQLFEARRALATGISACGSDQAVEAGMTKYEASWLVSSIGISNTISRPVTGWLADKKFVNRMLLFETLLILIGINTAVSPLLSSFETKMAYCCIHGFLLGGYVTLIPVVLADLFGTKVIEKSFGLTMFAIGIAVMVSLPVGGWIFDQTGSYNITFVVAGSEFVAGGLILLVPLMFQRLRRHNSANITDQPQL